ncbi:MAG: hypothetical protein K0U12_03720 [Gammaproteobacteria bacterium]|nr:hypothetical protein [Gammaproteobacteria bacterium]
MKKTTDADNDEACKTLTIIGLGVAGQDCLNSVLADKNNVFSYINIIEPNKDVCIDIEKQLNDNEKIEIAFYPELEKCRSNLGVTFVSVLPTKMQHIIEKTITQPIDALVIEKPGPLPSLRKDDQVYQDLKNFGDKLFICHQRQYAEHFLWVRNQLKEGKIGAADHGVLTLGRWDYLTAGTHWMAFCHSLFGAPVDTIGEVRYSGNTSEKYKYDVEDEAFFTIKHSGGVTVQWRIGPEYGNRSDLRILAEHGCIDVKYDKYKLARQYDLSGEEIVCNDYGNPRYKILEEIARGHKPAIGCRLEDLDLYLQLFSSIRK